MDYLIGIDDTDTLESRGTGHLARQMAEILSGDFSIHGVTRHQLLFDDRVPKTAKNSCAAILFSGPNHPLHEIAALARKIMLDDFQPGSDPGLCLVAVPSAAMVAIREMVNFGQLARQELLTQARARKLAGIHKIYLEGLGGSEDGVIGALAAVGLALSGDDGRYVSVGNIRSLKGIQTVADVLRAGIQAVRTLNGQDVYEGWVQADKLRPSRRDGQPVLFVEAGENCWMPLKLD